MPDDPLATEAIAPGMAQLVHSFDWAKTSLGPRAQWPISLSTSVQVMLASGHAMCLVWGADRTLLYNDAYAPMLGLRHPAALGMRMRDAWPEVWNDIEPLVDAAFAGETSTFQNMPLAMTRHGDIEETWWTFSYSPVQDETGGVAGMLNVTLETTPQVRAERQRDDALRRLQANEAKLSALLAASSDAVYSMSPDWLEMRQLDGQGFLADTDSPSIRWVDEYLFPEDQASIFEAIRKAIDHKAIFELEHRVRQSDGSAGWTLSRAVPVLAADGKIVEWFGMATDTTLKRKAEAALLANDRELRKVNVFLKHRIDARSRELLATEDQMRQLQKLDALGQLTGGVAHDFNNLLTIIKSAVELLIRQGHIPEKRNRYIKTISSTTEKAVRLTSQLLDFARRKAYTAEIFDVSRKVREVCEMLSTIAGQNIEIVVHDPHPASTLAADVGQFETALINLAVNARDAMPNGGRLTMGIDAEDSSERILVSVSDTGTGIAPHQLDKIFEPFFTTKPVGKGTGLGLSQVHSFVQQCGGELRVESQLGKGTTFKLLLPKHGSVHSASPSISEANVKTH